MNKYIIALILVFGCDFSDVSETESEMTDYEFRSKGTCTGVRTWYECSSQKITWQCWYTAFPPSSGERLKCLDSNGNSWHTNDPTDNPNI